ncbi:hypothetical protein AC249_AIPGENE26629 [Exaiptasia diaphana]|nr:hypothetical protein AC249_AIPGENE26629 [Exaiptasia diaphana]
MSSCDKLSAVWMHYLHQRNKVVNLVKAAHSNYLDSVTGGSLHVNPKKFWSYVKQARCENIGIPTLYSGDSVYISDSDKAEVLNTFFQSIFTQDNDILPTSNPCVSNIEDISEIEFFQSGVKKLLAQLNPSKSAGPDGISQRCLKELSKEVSGMLTAIFQQSYNNGALPNDWLKAMVEPVKEETRRTFYAKEKQGLRAISDEPNETTNKTLAEYYANIRDIVKKCDYGSHEDDANQDHLIRTMNNNKIRTKAIKDNLTLSKILTETAFDEQTTEQVGAISKQLDSERNSERIKKIETKRPKTQGSQRSSCLRCGSSRRHQRNETCPAIGATCKNFGKVNHWARVRLGKPQKQQVQENNQRRNNQEVHTIATKETTR